jgi:alkylhydroperoxidase family enzyme
MARIPYAEPLELSATLRRWQDNLPANPKLFLMMSHAQNTTDQLLQLGKAQLDLALSPRLCRMVTLTVAEVAAAEYVWCRQVPPAEAAGVTEEQRMAIKRGDFDARVFDERDRAVLNFAAAVVTRPQVDEEIFDAVRAHLTDREIVELLQVAGYYWTISRICTVLQIDP